MNKNSWSILIFMDFIPQALLVMKELIELKYSSLCYLSLKENGWCWPSQHSRIKDTLCFKDIVSKLELKQ